MTLCGALIPKGEKKNTLWNIGFNSPEMIEGQEYGEGVDITPFEEPQQKNTCQRNKQVDLAIHPSA